jgi:hypothetical protein
VVERGVEELRDARAARSGLPGRGRRRRSVVYRRLAAWLGLGLHDQREPIEELPHPRSQRSGELVEGAADVTLEGGPGQALDKRAREVQRGHLGQREPGVVEATERALLQRPVLLAVMRFVEQRKPGRLQRLEVAPDGAGRDAGALGQIVDGDPARRFQVAENRPLPDDLGVTHGGRPLQNPASAGPSNWP